MTCDYSSYNLNEPTKIPSQKLLLANSTKKMKNRPYELFTYQNIFVFIGLLCVVTLVLFYKYVRDVILDEGFQQRRNSEGKVDTLKRTKMIYKESFKLICE